ncbi:DJ-1/PfpI family protein [Hydrogenophaga sp.]|uniref:DJ-1/PfpI family protein n=1 Tax=Hydrogenophaga sp. TaxID=1904254 RepID=UPI002FCA609C
MNSSPQPKVSPLRIGMVVFPGMTALDFAGPLEVFARLPGAEVHVLAKTLEPVRTDIGFFEVPTLRLTDAPALDLLFIGGGPGVNPLMEDDDVLHFFARRAPQAQWITSVCTGALVLGAAGLLRGYRAATHWAAMEVLPLLGAIPTDERVVIDRNRITGGGVTAGLDFALTVAAQMHGEGLARGMQLAMEYDPKPPFAGGSPRSTPADLVAEIRATLQPGTDLRLAAARRIAARKGWNAPA